MCFANEQYKARQVKENPRIVDTMKFEKQSIRKNIDFLVWQHLAFFRFVFTI